MLIFTLSAAKTRFSEDNIVQPSEPDRPLTEFLSSPSHNLKVGSVSIKNVFRVSCFISFKNFKAHLHKILCSNFILFSFNTVDAIKPIHVNRSSVIDLLLKSGLIAGEP